MSISELHVTWFNYKTCINRFLQKLNITNLRSLKIDNKIQHTIASFFFYWTCVWKSANQNQAFIHTSVHGNGFINKQWQHKLKAAHFRTNSKIYLRNLNRTPRQLLFVYMYMIVHVYNNEDVLLILNNQRVKNQILSTKQENIFQNVRFHNYNLCPVSIFTLI